MLDGGGLRFVGLGLLLLALAPALDDGIEDRDAREGEHKDRQAIEAQARGDDPDDQHQPEDGDDDHLRRGQGTTVGHSDRLLAAKKLSSFACEVGEDEVSTSTLDREQALHHDTLAVDPAIETSSLDHSIFATDLIGCQG